MHSPSVLLSHVLPKQHAHSGSGSGQGFGSHCWFPVKAVSACTSHSSWVVYSQVPSFRKQHEPSRPPSQRPSMQPMPLFQSPPTDWHWDFVTRLQLPSGEQHPALPTSSSQSRSSQVSAPASKTPPAATQSTGGATVHCGGLSSGPSRQQPLAAEQLASSQVAFPPANAPPTDAQSSSSFMLQPPSGVQHAPATDSQRSGVHSVPTP